MKCDVNYCLQHSFEYNQSLNIYRNFKNTWYTVNRTIANGSYYEIEPCSDNIFGICAYEVRAIVRPDGLNNVIIRYNDQTDSDFDITLNQNSDHFESEILVGKIRVINNSGQNITLALRISSYNSKERLQQAGVL